MAKTVHDRDTYDSRKKNGTTSVPEVYSGRRDAAAPQPGRAADDRPAADGVLYEPSYKAAVAGAAARAGAAPQGRGRADVIAKALAEILEQETMLYRDAYDISSKKTDIIVHGKIEELESLVKAEQAIIIKIGRLEDEREKTVAALAGALDMDLEGVTLSEINVLLGRDVYAKLENCQSDLIQTLGGLKETNDTNAQLIQNALDYVNFSVNLLTTNQNSGSLYSQDGEDGDAPRRSIFDVRR